MTDWWLVVGGWSLVVRKKMLGRKTDARQFLAPQTSDFRFLTSVFLNVCGKNVGGIF